MLCIYVMAEKPQSPKTVAEKLKRRINLNHNLIVGVLSRQILENVQSTTSIHECNQRVRFGQTRMYERTNARHIFIQQRMMLCVHIEDKARKWFFWLSMKLWMNSMTKRRSVLIVQQFRWVCIIIIVCRCLLHKPFRIVCFT